MTEEYKQLILTAIGKSKSMNCWSQDVLEQYLDCFRENEAQIPKSVLRDTVAENIIEWVNWYDKDLKQFKYFNKMFESTRTKVLSISKMGVYEDKIIEATKKNFKPVKYDPVKAGTWEKPELVYAEELKEHYEYWFAIKAQKELNEPIEIKELTSEMRKYITDKIKQTNHDFEKLETLVAKYFSSSRIINIVRIEKAAGNISFSTDAPPVLNPDDEDGKGAKGEDRLPAIRETVISTLKLSGEKEKVISELKEKAIVNKISVKGIRPIAEDEYLVVPHKNERRLESEDGFNEKNTNEGTHINLSNVKRESKNYYEAEGSFKGFFTKHPNFDLSTGPLDLKVEGVKDTIISGKGFYLCMLDDHGHIEVLRIDVNSDLKFMKISTAKGGVPSEKVFKKLDTIFTQ